MTKYIVTDVSHKELIEAGVTKADSFFMHWEAHLIENKTVLDATDSIANVLEWIKDGAVPINSLDKLPEAIVYHEHEVIPKTVEAHADELTARLKGLPDKLNRLNQINYYISRLVDCAGVNK